MDLAFTCLISFRCDAPFQVLINIQQSPSLPINSRITQSKRRITRSLSGHLYNNNPIAIGSIQQTQTKR